MAELSLLSAKFLTTSWAVLPLSIPTIDGFDNGDCARFVLAATLNADYDVANILLDAGQIRTPQMTTPDAAVHGSEESQHR